MTVKRLNLLQKETSFEPDRVGNHGKDGQVREAGFFGRNITMDYDGRKFNRGSLVDFL